MFRRLLGLVAAAFLASGSALCAQQGGSVELGAFGRYNWFDSKAPLKDAFGGGGRLGVFFDPHWELEAQASYAKTSFDGTGSIGYTPITGRLQYNLWSGSSAGWIFGLGYTYHMFSDDFEKNLGGAQGLVGFRVGRQFGLRADLTLDYIFHGWNDPGVSGTKGNWNPGVQLGVSFLTGTNPDHDHDGVKDKLDTCTATPAGEPVDASGCSASQRDTDHDGVKDNHDKCPDSKPGSPVDATGCPPDSDGDQVADALDMCPNTPHGTVVDATGCPPDADGDKVPDSVDKCPNTPIATVVDATGCPMDGDHDGVSDNFDKCPTTPAGESVNSVGCSASQRDTDGDGIRDNLDKCPNTAPGSRVDAYGCNVVLFEQGMKALVLEGVTFQTGKAALTPASASALDRVAEGLKEYQDLTIEIGGHTDNTGGRASNIRLSKARADAVKSYLMSRGVAANRMTTKGYGPDAPIADNKTSDGRAKNRRVELKKTSR
ncbi:MAG TPA: OmpA family protein [Gemmatimonadales bacterium]|nr:OmpA family protein [Gemmatimonadales bacterium]